MYFRVVVKGGHVGSGKYKELVFYIQAKDSLSAGLAAKKFPGVKHTSHSGILSVKSVTEDEYINAVNNHNAYNGEYNG